MTDGQFISAVQHPQKCANILPNIQISWTNTCIINLPVQHLLRRICLNYPAFEQIWEAFCVNNRFNLQKLGFDTD